MPKEGPELRSWHTLHRLRGAEVALLVTASAFLFVLPIPHTVTLRLVLLFSAAAIAMFLTRRYGLPRLPLLVPFALWAAVAFISLTTAVDPLVSLGEIKTELLYGFVAYAVFYSQTRNDASWYTWLATATAILAALSVANVTLWYRGAGTESPRGIYNGVGAYTTVLITLLPFVVLFLFSILERSKLRWVMRASPLLLLIPAYLTVNRTIWIVLAVSALFLVSAMFWCNDRLRRKRALLLLTISALLLISLYAILAGLQRRVPVEGNPAAIVDQTLAQDQRAGLWRFTVDELVRRPFQGIGFGASSFSKAYPQWISHGLLHAHNVFLNAAIQMGIQGVIALAIVFAAVAREFWRLYRSANPVAQWIGAAGLTMVLAVVTRNMTDDFFRRDLALLFWSLVGAGLGYGHRIVRSQAVKSHA